MTVSECLDTMPYGRFFRIRQPELTIHEGWWIKLHSVVDHHPYLFANTMNGVIRTPSELFNLDKQYENDFDVRRTTITINGDVTLVQ